MKLITYIINSNFFTRKLKREKEQFNWSPIGGDHPLRSATDKQNDNKLIKLNR